jgi:hypothetical protein
MGREEERVKVKMEPGGDDFDDTDSEDRLEQTKFELIFKNLSRSIMK